MKKAFVIIFFLLLLLIKYSCQEPAPSLLTSRVDSLIQEVDSLNFKIVSANLDSMRNLYAQISSNHTILTENLSMFSELEFDKERYLQLDSITLIVGLCLDACNDFHSEIYVIENQLEMIKEEIANGKIPDASLRIKIEQESFLLGDITTRVLLRMELLGIHLGAYYKIQPEIQGYVEQIAEKYPIE
jgi:hypothetical protein